MTASSSDTISLIGMPGAGKSTVGVLLAKLSGLRFVDTDLDIQVHAGATLQEIIDRSGYLHLREVEEQVLLQVALEGAIVSTGGSVVYSDRIMRRLAGAGPVLYLRARLDTLQRRVAAQPLRGIACAAGQDFTDVYAERTPLYQHYADAVVDVDTALPETIAQHLLAAARDLR